ncbi:YggS family pyridoxal phosphate-dependent enzyme [Alphaproteobacteria bacterium]|nr:YggS family pyridoxal phosphate-dependent enzyme [Alphaproteobacteria bacterium]
MNIESNLKAIQSSIFDQCKINNRNIKEIEITAVSKKQSVEKIDVILNKGHKVFGENTVQECKKKWPLLKEKYPNIRLHLIGKLQTNKVKDALKIFDVIETLDNEKLAKALSKEELKTGKKLKYFIQVNTGNEPQKNGILIKDAKEFLNFTRINHKLNIVGLMCIPPKDDEPSLHFSLLADLGKRLNLTKFSMGMSKDYKIALDFGSTNIRIGESIFGPRI